MKTLLTILTVFLTVTGISGVTQVMANELSGDIAVEYRFFSDDSLHPGQKKDNASIAVQSEYYHEWENGAAFTFVPFVRLDSEDSERTHFDIRELNALWVADSWEMRIGIGKVFWGATEFVHLVDIINQADFAEAVDGEDKLGQPMVHFSMPKDWGTLDMFLLPYFRERTFPGTKGRLRSSLVVDTDHPKYENDDEERHMDFALRYSHSIGNTDLGIYHFKGTGREPTLIPGLDEEGKPVLFPFYEQIDQTGADFQVVAGEWLLKFEALYRTGQGEFFFSGVGGFEYTFTRFAETSMDLGVIGEYVYDDRGDDASTPYANDIMFGLRLAVNDMASSEVLVGMVQDSEKSSRAVSLEASRRFGDRWKAILEAGLFSDISDSDLLYDLRDDDYIRLEIACYF